MSSSSSPSSDASSISAAPGSPSASLPPSVAKALSPSTPGAAASLRFGSPPTDSPGGLTGAGAFGSGARGGLRYEGGFAARANRRRFVHVVILAVTLLALTFRAPIGFVHVARSGTRYCLAARPKCRDRKEVSKNSAATEHDRMTLPAGNIEAAWPVRRPYGKNAAKWPRRALGRRNIPRPH